MKSRIFTDFSEKEIEFFLEHTEQKVFSSNQTVFMEGDLPSHMYIIKSGSVEVYIDRKDKNIELAKLYSGDFFGEMAILREDKRSASVKTLEDSVLIIIDRNTVTNIIKQNGVLAAKFLYNLAEVLAERLANTNKEVENWFLINDALVENEQFRKIYFKTHKK